MNNLVPLPPEEKPSVIALTLSVTVHLLLVGALFLGVQWKSHAPSTVEVEVWRAAPPPAPVVEPEPLPEPPPPKPVPKVEPTPPIKPDIAIKDNKKKKEEPKKPEPKKPDPRPEPKPDKPKKPDPKPDQKRDRSDFQKQIDQDLKQNETQRVLDDQRARAATEATSEASHRAQIKAEQAFAARSRGLAAYGDKIRAKIKGNIILPPSIRGNPEAIFIVTQLPTGEILPPVKIQKSSGNKSLDEAIERAILKSSPLPKPDQADLFQRVLELKYKPFDE